MSYLQPSSLSHNYDENEIVKVCEAQFDLSDGGCNYAIFPSSTHPQAFVRFAASEHIAAEARNQAFAYNALQKLDGLSIRIS